MPSLTSAASPPRPDGKASRESWVNADCPGVLNEPWASIARSAVRRSWIGPLVVSSEPVVANGGLGSAAPGCLRTITALTEAGSATAPIAASIPSDPAVVETST